MGFYSNFKDLDFGKITSDKSLDAELAIEANSYYSDSTQDDADYSQLDFAVSDDPGDTRWL